MSKTATSALQQMQAQREESDRAVLAVFNGALDAMLIADDEGRYIDANAAACELMGLPRGQIVGRPIHSFSPGIDAGAFALVWDRFLSDGHQRGEFELRRADGQVRWVEFSATARIRPGQHLSVIRDVSHKRRSDSELRRSEQNFRALMELAPDGVMMLREERVLYANPALVDMFGYRRSQIVGKPSLDLVVPEEREQIAARINALEVGQSISMEWSCLRGDGTRATIESSILCLILDEEETYLSYCRDVTERKQILDQLRRSEENFRTLIESAPDGVLVQRYGRIVYVNRVLLAMLGYAHPGELLGNRSLDLVHPDDQAAVLAAREAPNGLPLEMRLLRRDGTPIWTESTALSLLFDGEPARTIVLRDVTERKHMQSRLMIADRMVSVGTLAAGVAHEINNPLSYVIANLTLLNEELERLAPRLAKDTAEELRETIRDARSGSERIRQIVRDLKTLSRGDDEHRELVDVRRVLDSCISMARNEIRHRAELIKDYPADLPPVLANESRLGQVFLNLVVNAAQAIPDGRAHQNQIRVDVRAERGRVIIQVSDTGSGIAPGDVPRIFDPFFTTKAIGVGTGLGLPICRRIVTSLDGEISVESRLGQGSTFTVELPARSYVEAPPPPAPAPPPVAAARGRVLVVDDEVGVGNVVRRALEQEHDVVSVQRADDALARLARGERYDVLLCDVMMPDKNGADLFDELSRRDPEHARRVVFITGGAFTPRVQSFLAEVPNERLDKPFDLAGLRLLVRNQVATRRAA